MKKEGWKISTIESICYHKSSNIVQNKLIDNEGVYPLYGASSLVKKIDFYHQDTEYIGIVKDGSGVGRIDVFPAYSSLLGTMQYIFPKDGYLLRYVSYALKSVDLSSYATGIAIPHIYFKDYGKARINIHTSTSIQEQIVAELDALNDIIAKRREQLDQLDTLAQATFYDMFGDPVNNEKGWEVKRLEEVCTKITDGTHDTPERLTEGVKFITGKHIRPFSIDYDNSDYVLTSVHKEIYKRCNPEYEDVLYTNIGANMGTAAMNIVEYEFSMKNVALLKQNRLILRGHYLTRLLNTPIIKERIISSGGAGGAQSFLSLKQIKSISILLPPLPLQNQFAERIEAIEKQKELIKQSIVETQLLFDYTMDKYFN